MRQCSALDAIVIDGVNHNLNGVNNSQDFWPTRFHEENPSDAHYVESATIPEPATGAFFLLGATLFVLRWSRKSSAP